MQRDLAINIFDFLHTKESYIYAQTNKKNYKIWCEYMNKFVFTVVGYFETQTRTNTGIHEPQHFGVFTNLDKANKKVKLLVNTLEKTYPCTEIKKNEVNINLVDGNFDEECESKIVLTHELEFGHYEYETYYFVIFKSELE